MARDFTPDSSDRLDIVSAAALSNAPPMTFLCRCNLDSKASYRGFYELIASSDGTRKHAMNLSEAAGNNLAYHWEGGSDEYGIAGPVINLSEWTACALVVQSTRADLYTGTQAGAQNTAANVKTHTTFGGSTLDSINIGKNNESTDRTMDGRICECAIYLAALTADEVLGYQRGFSPMQIRPASLTFYAPLVRDLVDRKSGLSMTATGTTIAVHAPVIMPRRRGFVNTDAAAAAGLMGARFEMMGQGISAFSGGRAA